MGVLDDIEPHRLLDAGEPRRAADRMPRIGVAVIDRAERVLVGLEARFDLVVDDAGAEREIARRDRLGEAHDVGLHAPGARSRPGAGAAEAGDDLVRDQQDVVLVEQRTELGPIGGGRHDDAAGPHHRLGDHGGDGIGALELDLLLERGEAKVRQPLGIGLVEGIAIGKRRRSMKHARHQRLVGAAEIGIAVDRGATEMRAVIALLEGQELHAVGLALYLPILPRDAERALDRVRATGGEKRPAHALGRQELDEPVAELDQRRVRRAAEGGVVGKLGELAGDRLLNGLARVAEIDVPQAADRVDDGVAVEVRHPHALAFDDDLGRQHLHLVRMRHGMPDLLGVVLTQEVRADGITHGLSPLRQLSGRSKPKSMRGWH